MFTQIKGKDERGFTLIELLIVVAIIAILAAIAIPQFGAYRIRGFNAAANSDVRNAATTEEALFADTQGHGAVANAVLGTANCTATTAGPITGALNAATTAVAGGVVQNALGSVGFGLSSTVAIASDGVAAANNTCTSYVLVAKHTNGDACFGRDSDSTSMFRAVGTLGSALTAASVPNATTGTNDVTGAGTGVCTGTWTSL